MAALRRPAAVATRTASSWRSRRSSRRQAGRRRLLDELLVAALERAVALPERDDAPVRVAEQLDLDVARRADLALQVDRPVAERGRPPRPSRRRAPPAGPRRRSTRRMPRPPPPAAALTSSGKPIASASATIRATCVGPVDRRRLERPGHGGDADRRGPAAGRAACRRARRSTADDGPTKTRPGVLDGPGERRPLGQEAVARMDRLGAGRRGGLDDRVDAQVALGRRRRARAGRRRRPARTCSASASASL